MIRANIDNRPKGDLSLFENEIVVAQLRSSWNLRSSRLIIGDTVYSLYRQKLLSGDFVLDLEGKILGNAKKEWSYGGRFQVEYQGKSYRFVAKWPYGWSLLFSPRLFLYYENEQIGSVVTRNGLTREVLINLPDELDLCGKAFITWLWVIIYRRGLFGLV